MADYKELLRRAVEALPENNGAARRAVYEKARAALVGQLRAINPPLAARDITAHRLQLEDCIRQVEQEASEAVIAGLGSPREEAAPPPPAPVFLETTARKLTPAVAKPVAKAPATPVKEPPKPLPPGDSIEEIIAAANAEHSSAPDATRSMVRADNKPVGKPLPKLVATGAGARAAITEVRHEEGQDDEPDTDVEDKSTAPAPARGPVGRPVPSIVARAEAMRNRPVPVASGPSRGPVIEPRRDLSAVRGAQQAVAARQVEAPVALFESASVPAAMSAVREVEVEAPVADPQSTIDRAIAALDREARGDGEGEDEEAVARPAAKNGHSVGNDDQSSVLRMSRDGNAVSAASMVRKDKSKGKQRRINETPLAARSRRDAERGGIGAVTVFLIVFAVLLVGAGGAGIWAWREGYINLDAMFGRAATTTEQAASANSQTPVATADAPATGPGNTDTRAEAPAPAAVLGGEERLGTSVVSDSPALALTEAPVEERLTGQGTDAQAAAEAAVAAVDPTNLAGSQSLLLEASDSGTTGAVPFSGTVEWSKGTDETGLPTLIGKASIPARNLGVELLIRKNSDPSLPASHLMEINFKVSESFIGGSIAGLPGVLLKNEELVQGSPLIGASARVVGNSFLFALSASASDVASNVNMLMQRKWMDLALIYATGKRAIITLEKDADAQALFTEVVQAWIAAPTPAASNG
jgi:hypothetical protein